MNYVGIDWSYGRAAFCAMSETGAIASEGLVPADEDGLAKLVLSLGTEVKGCVEMMSGAVWVRDRLQAAGWEVQVAFPSFGGFGFFVVISQAYKKAANFFQAVNLIWHFLSGL